MIIYLDIIRFNFLRFLAYPTEIWAAIIKQILTTGFLLVFWSIIAKSSHGTISLTPLISYFLTAGAVDALISAQDLRFGAYIGGYIKNGSITTHLIRPLHIIPYLISSSLGERSLGLLLAIVTFCIGILIYPPSSLLSIALFLIFLGLAATISLAINVITAIFYFYSPEARGFLYSVGHVVKVFSGAIVPLTLFPQALKRIALLSPFPGMVFAPVSALHTTSLNADLLTSLAINATWAAILLTIALTWWKKAMRSYDAVGI